MVKVQEGTMSIEKASSLQKMAGRINESLYAEAKILHIVAPGDKSRKLGSMEIH